MVFIREGTTPALVKNGWNREADVGIISLGRTWFPLDFESSRIGFENAEQKKEIFKTIDRLVIFGMSFE